MTFVRGFGAVCLLLVLMGFERSASALPTGWVCIGNCETSGASGVVTAPPGGTSYDWVSTSNGTSIGHLGLGAETDGSLLRSDPFVATPGDNLQFNFNYVTSDGAGYADYAWARLLDGTLSPVALLFTARTTPGGNTAPGFGMPANAATLTPASTPIIDGGPVWAPLGSDSGACFSGGCGYTGWIQSNYTIALGGSYILEFGVANWSDGFYASGLALSGATVGGTPIDDTTHGDPIGDPIPPGAEVPEPGTCLLLGSGLGLVALTRRLRSRRRA